MRLFVDCDDTLILYDSEGCGPTAGVHPYGFVRNEPYRINEPLVAFVKAFCAKYPDALITIWSGGGDQYAAQVAKEVGLGEIGALYVIKDRTTFALVGEDDIVVDDQELRMPHLAEGWHPVSPGFFDNKDNWGL